MTRIEIEDSRWNGPFMRVVIEPDKVNDLWYRTRWNEFKKRIDDQFEMFMNKREGLST